MMNNRLLMNSSTTCSKLLSIISKRWNNSNSNRWLSSSSNHIIDNNTMTDFGFEKVNINDKEKKVGEVFNRVAEK